MSKLFYMTTEIIPFANTSSLAPFSTKVPLLMQEKGHDIRTIIPKYGYVSERKYILREVIRLRDIPFEYNGEEKVLSAKSAFIPKTRVQVYFLEDNEWFKPQTNLVYKSKNGRILTDNDQRFSIFCKATLATLPHLFWKPDIFLCNGWQSSFVPA
ncbi:MAG TPA: glycogen/starch synthase, partial [Candidatus Marinimicrobia bacterium]|nr:glycogen/starch synthase [Candidatus Neomarinimicrobiota bacterium]